MIGGRQPWPSWVYADSTLDQVGRWLRRVHDAYGHEGDRSVFGPAIAQRARRQASVIREMAAAGDPASTALLPIAGVLDQSAVSVEALPASFWSR